jgi:hypothetical protein
MFLFLTSIYNMLFSVNFALRVKVFFFPAVSIKSSCEMYKSHRGRNGVRLECVRSWVRVPVGSN